MRNRQSKRQKHNANLSQPSSCQFCNIENLSLSKRLHPYGCLYLYSSPNIKTQIHSDRVLEYVSKELFLSSLQYQKVSSIKIRQHYEILEIRINASLFQRYSQSQNYHFTRDVNKLIAQLSCLVYIRFKDQIAIDFEQELMKRNYSRQESQSKLKLLVQYYKFHKDVPRIFLEPQSKVLNKYLDKKRKLDYYEIAKQIQLENKLNPQRPPKGIVGDKPSALHSEDKSTESHTRKPAVQITRVLKDLTFLNGNDKSMTLLEICQSIQPVSQAAGVERELVQHSAAHLQAESAKLNKFMKFVEAKESQLKQRVHTDLGGKQYRILGTAQHPLLKLNLTPSNLIKSSLVKQHTQHVASRRISQDLYQALTSRKESSKMMDFKEHFQMLTERSPTSKLNDRLYDKQFFKKNSLASQTDFSSIQKLIYQHKGQQSPNVNRRTQLNFNKSPAKIEDLTSGQPFFYNEKNKQSVLEPKSVKHTRVTSQTSRFVSPKNPSLHR